MKDRDAFARRFLLIAGVNSIVDAEILAPYRAVLDRRYPKHPDKKPSKTGLESSHGLKP